MPGDETAGQLRWRARRVFPKKTPCYGSVLTAGVTGKRGNWRTKPPDAESAVWGRFLESVGECPHLSGARGVGPVLQDGLNTPVITAYIRRQRFSIELI